MSKRWHSAGEVFPDDTSAAISLLILSHALIIDQDGNLSKGSGSPSGAYCLGARLLLEGRIAIKKWFWKKQTFATTIHELYDEVVARDEAR